ncbi:DUF1097 domain-containing protein [Marinobacter sp.]|jgi:uncharacterized protein DUF1097|uniref:DUF1097 domain-containing protein n=1 Tax=Marinobacter sp. TaxID=50741 RepID=UPI003B515D3C
MKIDKFIVAVTVSIFLLAGFFNFLYEVYARSGATFNLAGLVPAGFLGWATFYAVGGTKSGVAKGIFSNISGVFWGVIIVLIWELLGFNLFGAFLAVAVGAGAMCFQAHFKPFEFIPGAFIGASTFFALGAGVNGETLWPVVIGLLLGGVFGFISEEFSKLINKKLTKSSQIN